MDACSSQNNILKSKVQKRPDSLKVELLTIPEDYVAEKIGDSEISNNINVGFKNLSYSVQEGIFHRRRKKILRQISGNFYGGELTAIMGPSGCGKTTLMNILAGFTTKNITGNILINDEPCDRNAFKKQSCYIMQDDRLHPLLTVYESMVIAANLKLSTQMNWKDKKSRIQEILEALGLWTNCKVRTCSLSGGQRRRLTVAVELLKNPQVMFFDEPTSGLDSSTSKQSVILLRQLAQEGKAVICTIHQPSALILEMFDHLFALATGRCIYQGSIKGMLPYFEELGLQCPPYHNPADYLLEVASEEYGPYTEELVIKSENGQNQDWRKHCDSLHLECKNHIDRIMGNGQITPVRAPASCFPTKTHSTIQNKLSKEIQCCLKQYPTSFINQLCILLKRSFWILSRDRMLTYSRIFTHLMVAFIIGILYFGIGQDAKDMQNNANYLFFTVLFLMLTSFNCVTLTFPSEVPIIVKENFNRWYSVGSYYMSVVIADTPVQILSTLCYVIITFYMTAQPLEWFRIFFFVFICLLVSFVGQSFGLLIGASLDMKTGVIMGPLCFLPSTIFSGFFVQFHDAHPYMRWLFYISYLKYGFEGLMLSIFGYERGKLPCSKDYCHFVYPSKFLAEMDMKNADYSHCIYFLIGLTLIIRVATYFILLIRLRR